MAYMNGSLLCDCVKALVQLWRRALGWPTSETLSSKGLLLRNSLEVTMIGVYIYICTHAGFLDYGNLSP